MMHIEVEGRGSMMDKVQASQRDDPELIMLIDYLEQQLLPEDPVAARKVAARAVKGYNLINGILYFEDTLVLGRR